MYFEMIFGEGYNIENWKFKNFVTCFTRINKVNFSVIKHDKNPVMACNGHTGQEGRTKQYYVLNINLYLYILQN